MDPTIFLWIGGVLVVITIAVGIYMSISGQKSAEEQRLGDYVETEVPVEEKKKEPAKSIVTDWVSKKVEKKRPKGKAQPVARSVSEVRIASFGN